MGALLQEGGSLDCPPLASKWLYQPAMAVAKAVVIAVIPVVSAAPI